MEKQPENNRDRKIFILRLLDKVFKIIQRAQNSCGNRQEASYSRHPSRITQFHQNNINRAGKYDIQRIRYGIDPEIFHK